jgi:hypothetical protein
MRRILTDIQISELLDDKKPIRRAYVRSLKTRLTPENRSLVSKRGITSDGGRVFEISARRDCRVDMHPKRFSIVLGFTWHGQRINLIRCNGWHAPHTNRIEENAASGVIYIPRDKFHVHYATERYQIDDMSVEYYAEPTEEYDTFEGAIEYMCDHFGFYLEGDEHRHIHPLFR